MTEEPYRWLEAIGNRREYIREQMKGGSPVFALSRPEGILLRPRRSPSTKLSWEETAAAMASAAEDWSEWDVTLGDGLDQIPWELHRVGRVAERGRAYSAAQLKRKRSKK